MPSTATNRLQGLTTSVAVKAPCITVATSNITLSGLQTISGVTVVEGDRVLVKGQSTASENGIYNASTGSWTRALDFDGDLDAVSGTRVLVRSTSIAVEYELTTPDPIVIGTTGLTFTLRYGANATYDQTEAEIAAGVTPTNYAIPSHEAIGEYLGARYGIDADNTAAANTAALTNAVAVCPALGTLRLPEGLLNFEPFTLTKAIKLLGAGIGKHGTSGNLGRTVWQCQDTNDFGLVCKRSESNGYDPFHIEGIRFAGNSVGYGGVHFGSDVADGGSYSNLTGTIVDCHFVEFTTYGLAMRRVFDVVLERVQVTGCKNASTLSTTGRGIALLANNPSSSSVTLDMTVITLRDCDTSNNHIGIYVEECEVLRILNHQASGNHREAIKLYSREYINNVRIEGGYYEVNNFSRNDAGWGGSYPNDFYEMDFSRDTGTTKVANNITGVIIDNPHFGLLSSNSGKVHFQHTFQAWMRARTASGDGSNIVIGNDAAGICLEVTNDITPYVDAGSFTTPYSLYANLSNTLIARNVDVYGLTGSFTGTFTGVAGTVTGDVNWSRHGKRVQLFFTATIEGTSNATSFTMTGLPAALQPVQSNVSQVVSELENNGVAVNGVASFGAGSGTVTFYISVVSGSLVTRSASGWTNSGTKGVFAGCRMDYYLD